MEGWLQTQTVQLESVPSIPMLCIFLFLSLKSLTAPDTPTVLGNECLRKGAQDN